MKGISRIVLLILVSVLFYQCQKELSFGNTDGNPGNGDAIDATIQGNIVDENNDPVEAVTIRVGTKKSLTDADGHFRITHAALNNRDAFVTAEKSGYFKAFRTFAASSGSNQVMIKLVQKANAGTINATSGGNVSLSNGTQISLPANSLVNALSGSDYSGTVTVMAAYIDPSSSDISQTVPGSFVGNDRNNKRVLLSSFGMVAVELLSGTGEKLQIKTGKTAMLTMLIPSTSLGSAPNSIALWYVDEQTGIWKEEGTATKNGNYYKGEVKHFSFWNCDIGVPAFNLSMKLITPSDIPIVHGLVRISTRGAIPVQTYGFTDSLGQVSGLVPANENLIMDVLDPCNEVIYSQPIPALTQNINLGSVTIKNSASAVVIVQGTLRNCTGAPVTNGYAIIYYDNSVRYAAVNAKGNFSVSVLQCLSVQNDMKIIGVDETTQQQSAYIAPNITLPITNTGNISACGNSSSQFINYTLDDTSYSLTTQDSFTVYTQFQQGSTQYITRVSGFSPPSKNFNIEFKHPIRAAGAYAVSELNIQSLYVSTFIQPLNVTITNFPQNIGEFCEGNFSGQFRDVHNINHTLTFNFRVRKTF